MVSNRRNGIYRGLVIAALGWLILAASPPQESGGGDKPESDSRTGEALGKIATAIQQANKPQKADAGCPKGYDSRNSDLCAQWKAADAAQESAEWTGRSFWLGVVGVFIGGLTLAAAGFAAWYAKRAANETRRSADAADKSLAHTKTISEIQLRPWVSIAVVPKTVTRERNLFAMEYDIETKNLGQTVALNCQMNFKVLFETDQTRGEIERLWKKWSLERVKSRKVLMPGETDVFQSSLGQSMEHMPWVDIPNEARRTAVFIVVSVYYQAATDACDAWHQTDRAFLLCRGGKKTGQRYLTEDDLNLGPGDLSIESFSANLAT